jgi:pimeloyl-ACP methyl ester carboxylesterase
MPFRNVIALVSALVVGSSTIAGAGAAMAGTADSRPTGPLDSFYAQRVSWEPCADAEGSECAFVEVPLDYRKPGENRISIALLRKAPANPGAPSLIFNPGGPGASATNWVDANGSLLVNPASPDITAKYALVGMDPRGVGRSTQLNCVSAERLAELNSGIDLTVAGLQSFAAATTLNEVCAKSAKGLTSNIGTDSAARDLDIVRSALGEEKLNFYGASYGSFLGMMYAHTFPTKVGRMILDGINGPLDNMEGIAKAQARGFEESLRGWAGTCGARGDACPAGVGKSQRSVLAWLRNLLNVIKTAPLAPTIGERITDRTILEIALGMLSDGQGAGFAALDSMLASAAARDADALGDYRLRYTLGSVNYDSVNQAVNCYDRPTSGTKATIRTYVVQWRKLAPFFAPLFVTVPSTCYHWSVRKAQGNLAVTPTTRAPVLLVNGLHDPATPVRMARQSVGLFPLASLLLWDGFGHVSGTRGNPCINDAVATYLVDGTLPQEGIVCPS